MASRLFARLSRGQWIASGAAVGGAGLAATSLRGGDDTFGETAAQVQFNTSSVHVAPAGYEAWQIRNDYPTSEILKSRIKAKSSTSGLIPAPGPAPGLGDDFEGENAPWLKFDFEKEHERYAEAIRRYCFDGMVDAKFRPQQNKIRDWYHAPWMHYRDPKSTCTEREPINGFTFERATPAYEFANTQDVALQNWACGFYNATGATVFGDMWKDANNPDFSKDKQFPTGTCVFKILLNNATNRQLPMEGSPTMHGCISKSTENGRERNDFASPLRLVQVDFAVVDHRSPIGWVFGTYMFDQSRTDKEPWERLTLVGLQWGNDPWLTQEVYDKGSDKDPSKPPKPRQSWINPVAENIRLNLKGARPSWGWNGRMNGPADNFISACASCHSTAIRDHMKNYGMTPPIDMKTRKPKPPNTDANVMNWFRDVPAGQPFDQGLDPKNPSVYEPENPNLASKTKSCDYSLQLQVGWANYNKWRQDQENILQRAFRGTRMVISDQPDPANISQRDALRQGPDVVYEKKE